jgi:type IV pilus assembly protein PilV
VAAQTDQLRIQQKQMNNIFNERYGIPARTRAADGFTLIEILVTLVIISVGLLGIAGLHSMSLRNNFDALIRSHASALADEIADRMRTNRTRALAGDYNVGLGASRSGVTQADADLSAWKARLATQLPNGDGSVALVAAPSRLVTITIQWGERGQTDPVTFVTQTEI